MITEEDLQLLEKIYEVPEHPRCPICNEELQLESNMDGFTFACDGKESDPDNLGHWRYEEGRSFLDDHYKASVTKRYKLGDAKVIELIKEYRKLLNAPRSVMFLDKR